MTTYSINTGSAKFLLGVPTYDQLKPTRIPEIAVVGRSNVGKSSFINRAFGVTALARTSSTPGKTQEINFFQAELKSEVGEKAPIIVADLPGYGYAQISKVERERMGKLTVDYISKRKELEVVLLLNDSKRVPEHEELSVLKLAVDSGRSIIIVLTKMDRFNQREKTAAIKEIAAAYQVSPEQLLLSGKDIRTDTLWNLVGATLWGEGT